MSEPDADQELERLLALTRAETQPDRAARERIRRRLSERMAEPTAPPPRRATSKRLLASGAGLALLGALWFQSRSLPPHAEVRPTRSTATASSLPPDGPEPPHESTVVIAPSVAPSVPPSVATASSARASSRSPSRNSEGPSEVALIAELQRALRRGDASRALALADEHERRYPRGTLIQEREGARVIARCGAARPEARSALRADFQARYPGSPYAARVEAACEP
ncbi:MAG: hypothetical protein EOO73_28010 [Myxococcales bacterium]|nr:MAG: hypothetical protein EOO73_28010 [Myxococcales bacterium]